ncbi:MAG TPA: MauE/DoxX family redox-associated membrane protein [Sphingobium sp.]
MMLSSGLSVAGLGASIGVGLIFLTAGAEKLRHRALLPGVIANYRLLPERMTGPVAAILPFAEVAVGAGLIVGLRPAPVLIAMLLLITFAVAMAINIGRGRRHIDCGCGGPELRQPLGWPLVLRNLALVALLLPRLLPSPALSGVDIFTAAAAGIGAFVGYMLFQTIGGLIASPTHSIASRR